MKISIITPIYNEEKYIEKYLDSLAKLKFPHQDLKIIFVNDCSTDGTVRIVEKFIANHQELDIKLLHNDKNMGVLFTRNRAAKEVQTEYFINIDAHSIIDPNLVKNFISIHLQTGDEIIMGNDLLETNNPLAIFQHMILRRIYGKETTKPNFKDYYIDNSNFEKTLKGTSPLFIKKELFLKATPQESGKDVSDDIKLLQNILKLKGKFLRTSKAFCIYLSRRNLLNEIKHVFQRGPKFVDYYFNRGTKFYPYLLLMSVFSLLTPLLIASIVYLTNWEIFFGIVLVCLGMVIVVPIIIFARSTKEAFVCLLFPIYFTAFLLGIYNGLARKLDKNLKKPRLLIILGFFLVSTVYLSFSFPIGTPPDEVYHTIVSLLHRNSLNPFIEEPAQYYYMSPISSAPFLYHYLLGLFSNLNFLALPLAVHMRLINPLISLGTLFFVYKSSLLLSKNKQKAYLATAMLSTTLMFILISSAISYDNLLNFFAIGSYYLILRLREKYNSTDLFWLLIVNLAGILTKFTFLPLSAIFFLVTLFIIYTNRKNLIGDLKKYFKRNNAKILLLQFSLIFIGFLLCFGLYGRNVIDYGTYQPMCDDVVDQQTCYGSSIQYRMHYDSRNDNIQYPSQLFSGFPDWALFNLKTTYGTLTHLGVFFSEYSIIPVISIFLLAIVGAISQFKKKIYPNISVYISLMIFIGYCLIVYIFNHNEYMSSGYWGGVQGRYLFPVWPILYILLSHYALTFKKNWVNTLIVILFFISSITVGYLYFLKEIPPEYKMDWHKMESYEEFYKDIAD